jgi:hypothetical protein
MSTQNEPQATEAHFQRFHEMLSMDQRTPARLLAAVAREASTKSLQRIAEHPHTTPQTLRELACHPAAEVKLAVAENHNCPEDVLAVLSCDENLDVRYILAESYHVPKVILDHLAEDDNPYVAFRAQKTLQRLNQTDCEVRTFNSAAGSSRRAGSMG